VLRPITDRHVEKALRVTGFDREALERDGRDPGEALPEFAAWIDALAAEHEALPVLAAYPLGFPSVHAGATRQRSAACRSAAATPRSPAAPLRRGSRRGRPAA